MAATITEVERADLIARIVATAPDPSPRQVALIARALREVTS